MISIDLSGNNLTGSGISSLSNYIWSSVHLKTLILQFNELGKSESGCQTFFEAIADNQSLMKLDLRNNTIGPEMGIYIGWCIQNNRILKDLDLRWNKLGINGIKILAEHAEYNEQLISLEIIGNNGGEENQTSIEAVLERNRRKGVFMSHPAYKSTKENLIRAGASSLQAVKGQRSPLIPIEIENQHVMLEEEKEELKKLYVSSQE